MFRVEDEKTLAPTHRGCGTPVRSRLGGMQKRRALRIGGSISGRPLAVRPSGGRRGRMRQRPGRVPGMLGPLEMLAPRLARRVAHVTTGNELRGTVQVGRRHHRRLLPLAAVSHFSPALLVNVKSAHTRLRSLPQHSAEASCSLAQLAAISPRATSPLPRISFQPPCSPSLDSLASPPLLCGYFAVSIPFSRKETNRKLLCACVKFQNEESSICCEEEHIPPLFRLISLFYVRNNI